jgi:uncharacterized damage-inducible protein DinB
VVAVYTPVRLDGTPVRWTPGKEETRTTRRRRGQADEIALMRAWCDWNSRSRGEYLEALLRLPPEERRRDRGASWGSIQDIYLHVVEDYIWWFEKVPRGQFDGFEALVGLDLDEKELRRLAGRVDRLVSAVMDGLTARDLRRPLTARGTSGDGKPYQFTTCLADIVWHMLEEELQHRGEMNALFWQMGIDPPTRSWFSSGFAID